MENTPSNSSAAMIRKILQILAVLDDTPSADVVRQQVTQLLDHLQHDISKNEQSYAMLAESILSILLAKIPALHPACNTIKILQMRIKPPLLAVDMDAIATQLDQLALQLDGVADSSADEAYVSPPDAKTEAHSGYAELSLRRTRYNRDGQGQGASEMSFYDGFTSDDDVTCNDDFYGGGVNTQDKDSLSQELRDAMDESRECGLLLTTVLQSLQAKSQGENAPFMHESLLSQLNQLQQNQSSLTRNLEKSYCYLSSVETSRKRLDKELSRARLLSLTDELTELPNRRAFLNRLEDEVGRVRRHKLPLAMAIIDLDGFKKVNDTHGHSVGDEVLRCYADEIFSTFRQYDLVSRYGGEEFAVLFPNTDRNGAICALRKVQKRVEDARKKYQDGGLPIPSFSAGLAVYRDDESLAAFIERADQAMYRAKSMGRDRIEVDAA